MEDQTPIRELLELALAEGLSVFVHEGRLYVRGPEGADAVVRRISDRAEEVAGALLELRSKSPILEEVVGPNGPHVLGMRPADTPGDGCLFCGEAAAVLGLFRPREPWRFRRDPWEAGTTVQVIYQLCERCAALRHVGEVESILEQRAGSMPG